MTEVIELEQVLNAMGDVVMEAGADFVYKKREDANGRACFYVWDDKPDCLIGRVLAKLGFTINNLKALRLTAISTACGRIHESLYGKFTNDAVRAMDNAQTAQDSSVNWGTCYAIARGYDNVNSALVRHLRFK